MQKKLLRAALGLLPIAVPLACGSLNKGEVVIVDEGGGTTNNGGSTSGSGGRAGSSTAGGASGKGGGGNGGGASGEAGEAGMGTSASGGSSNGGNGGKGGKGGTGGSSGKGGKGGTSGGTGGGGGEPPSDCTETTDCAGPKPICDNGTCRACQAPSGMDPDECADRTTVPHCDGNTGHCVQCVGSRDCPSNQPVCDENACRVCKEGSECESGACEPIKGRCADESSVVYVAESGSPDQMTCGTRETPCNSPKIGAALMGSARPFMVIAYTSRGFDTTVALPPGDNLVVFGNGVTLYSTDAPAVQINLGATVLLDDLDIKTTGTATGPMGLAAVECNDSNLKMVRCTISNSSPSGASSGLGLTNCSADIRQTTFSGNQNALVSSSTVMPPAQYLTVERSTFSYNVEAIDFNGGSFTIRNNLFLNNGQKSYIQIVSLAAAQFGSVFSYNTLYGNDNGCDYEGALVYCAIAGDGCGRQSSNLFWGNMYDFDGGTAPIPCPDQVYASWMLPTSIDYTIAEYAWSGTGNSTSNPRLADPANGDYTPSSTSPAIGKGEADPTVMPDVDYNGNPRPVGGAPDIGAIEVQ